MCIHQKMLVNLPSLELLDLSECENITDATVKAIVFHCRMLRSLSVAGCYRVHSLYSSDTVVVFSMFYS